MRTSVYLTCKTRCPASSSLSSKRPLDQKNNVEAVAMSQSQVATETDMLDSQDTPTEIQEVSQDTIAEETPSSGTFIPPSISSNRPEILSGSSYTHFSPLPQVLSTSLDTPCVLGIDEAGRGPVLGPMVYSVFYLPISAEQPLLHDTHSFMDSKVLTPAVRSSLMQTLCTSGSDLFSTCGWAVRVMSARDISAGMLKAGGTYNLNAQAMDATIGLINETFAKGVNVREIYIDTIGSPVVYQKKLERIFPTTRITVAKKADSLYPCVSAASVCAKVTRDAALEVCYESYQKKDNESAGDALNTVQEGWGSGYPSDARCTAWLRSNMDPFFGWGTECRFSWGTVKDMLEAKTAPIKIDWPEDGDEDEDAMKVTSFFSTASNATTQGHDLTNWFGKPLTAEVM